MLSHDMISSPSVNQPQIHPPSETMSDEENQNQIHVNESIKKHPTKRSPGTPLTPSVQPMTKKRVGHKYLQFEDDDARRIAYEHWLLQLSLDKNRQLEAFRRLEKKFKEDYP